MLNYLMNKIQRFINYLKFQNKFLQKQYKITIKKMLQITYLSNIVLSKQINNKKLFKKDRVKD